MKCPACSTVDLAVSAREGVEIDYCPRCRGIWLDRGELDKIVDRSSPPADADADDDRDFSDDRDAAHGRDPGRRPEPRRVPWWARLLD